MSEIVQPRGISATHRSSRLRRQRSTPMGEAGGPTGSTKSNRIGQIHPFCEIKIEKIHTRWFTPSSAELISLRTYADKKKKPTYRLAQRQGLPQACDDHYDFPALQHGSDTNSECHSWHFVDVVVEEAGVGENGVVREGLDASARRKGRACMAKGIVERRMVYRVNLAYPAR